MPPRAVAVLALWVAALGPAVAADAGSDEREACKKAMNARIQVCADDCTKAALAAVPSFVDRNNDVKFLCIKRCAAREIVGMQGCARGNG